MITIDLDTTPPTRELNALEGDLTGAFRAFIDHALAYSRQRSGLGDLREAWNVFRVWLSPQIDFSCEDWPLFLAWYVFHWQPSIREHGSRVYLRSIAERYLQECPEEASTKIGHLVQGASQSPLDFYEIHWFPNPNCLYIKSLLLGYQHSFAFSELPAGLSVGCVFFGKIVHIRDDRGILLGHSRAFPAEAKVAVARLRNALIKKQPADFARNFWLYDSDIFSLYQEIQAEFPPAP